MHYVVLYDLMPRGERPWEGYQVIPVLGAPFFEGTSVTAWAIPGVGTVPPAFAKASGRLPPLRSQ